MSRNTWKYTAVHFFIETQSLHVQADAAERGGSVEKKQLQDPARPHEYKKKQREND